MPKLNLPGTSGSTAGAFSTIRQRMLAQPEPEEKWYKGENPTSREVLAQIYTNTKDSIEQGRELYSLYEQSVADPTTPIYNPYTKPTNPAVGKITEMGMDLSGGVSQDWLNQNSWLKGSYRLGASGTPLAPSEDSTPENDAAYWYYKIQDAEEQTQRAETEWAALQEEVAYWVGRTDRNYSDDEVLSRIDWSDYPTLTRMDEGRVSGVPYPLNRSVGYSQDALYGVMWAARNNGGTGDPLADSVKYTLGDGNTWKENPDISARLNPASDKFNPYSVGCTMDDEALYFGVAKFDASWLEDNRGYLSSGDLTAKRLYQSVYEAEETTARAEGELAALQAEIERRLEYTSDPAKILAWVDWDAYPTLKKMDESLKSGKIMSLTRAVDYRKQDIEAEVYKRAEARLLESQDFASRTASALGAQTIHLEADDAVRAAKDANIEAAGMDIFDTGTPEEQTVFRFGKSAFHLQDVEEIRNAIQSGTLTTAQACEGMAKAADHYAGDHYLAALEAVRPYEAAVAARDEAQAAYDKLMADNPVLALYDEVMAQPTQQQAYEDTEAYVVARHEAEAIWQPIHDRLGSYESQPGGYPGMDEWIDLLQIDHALNNPGQPFDFEAVDALYAEDVMDEDTYQTELQRLREQRDGLDWDRLTNPETADTKRANAKALLWLKADALINGNPVPDDLSQVSPEEWARVEAQYNAIDWGLGEKMNDLLGDVREQSALADQLLPGYVEGLTAMQAVHDNYADTAAFSASYGVAGGTGEDTLRLLDFAYQYGGNYKPTNWTAYTLYDTALQDGYSVEQVVNAARVGLAEYEQHLADLVYLKDELSDRGICLSGEYADNIEREIALTERNIKDAKYYLIRDNEDFEQVVAGTLEKIDAAWGGFNLLPTAVPRGGYSYASYLVAHPESYTGETSSVPWQSYMSQDERDTYLYILGTEGEASATAYLDHLSNDAHGILQTRATQSLAESAAMLADGGWVGDAAATALTMIMSPLRLTGSVYAGLAGMRGEEINPHNMAFSADILIDETRGAVKDDITENFGEGTTGAFIANLGYDALTGAGDSMVNAVAFGGAGSTVMGASAFGGGVRDAKLRGAENTQALQAGSVIAAAELATEAITNAKLLDLFNNPPKNFKEALVKGVWDAGKEGISEAASEAITSVYDTVIMGELSNYNAMVTYNIRRGKPLDEARALAMKDALGNIIYAGVVGTISSGMSSAAAGTAGNVSQSNNSPKARAVEALGAAKADPSVHNRTSAIAAAIAYNGDEATTAPASAAAQHLSDRYGSEKAVDVARHVLITAQALGMENDGVALTVAGLVDGESKALLDSIANGDRSPETVRTMLEASTRDIEQMQDSLNAAVTENMVATRVKELIADGGLSGLQSYESAVNQAKQNLDNAHNNLQQAQERYYTAGRNLQLVGEQYLSNVDNASMRGAVQQATKDVESAAIVRQQMEQSVAKYETQLQEAQSTLDTQRETTMTQLREQARADVATAQQEAAVAREQQQAAAEEQRLVGNVNAVNTAAFMTDNGYENATDEQASQIGQAVAQPVEVSRANVEFASAMSRRFGVRAAFINDDSVDGAYDPKTKTVFFNRASTQGEMIYRFAAHELTHRAEASGRYNDLADALLQYRYGDDTAAREADLNALRAQYAAVYGNDDTAIQQELVAMAAQEVLGNEEIMQRMVSEKPSLARRVWEALKDFVNKLRGVNDPALDTLRRAEKLLEKSLDEVRKKETSVLNKLGVKLLGDGTATKYSLSSWTPQEQEAVRQGLVNMGFELEDINKWMNDVNSVAAAIAADKGRLDFDPAEQHTMLKHNQEYYRTLDASTLCAKRLPYQGTFNEVMHQLPNAVLTTDDLIDLRNMMAEMGYDSPCAVCYVESRRRNLVAFAEGWRQSYTGPYMPTLDDVVTTDGLERMRTEHPEVYKSFNEAMSKKGSNNPKVVELRTNYRGEIRKLSNGIIDKILKIGGLRVQSFSDFETPHLLDMMQAVLDMAARDLTSQAYTKVPNFAWVFGDTGIKINLSLLSEGRGLDENGNLVFSSYEGMDINDAMALRDRYSANVGTILVGVNDDHIKAAMADPRIDYIIPYHRSGWSGEQMQRLSHGQQAPTDYQDFQSERRIVDYYKNGNPKYKTVEENFHPVGEGGYWDFSLSGKENAIKYLQMCKEDGRIPKFEQFLEPDGEGGYQLPTDGSADGYWKMLIDFKMYDNDGNPAPQQTVRPNFNMEEAMRVLKEYEGGANALPVAQDVADRFVKQYQDSGRKFAKSGVTLPSIHGGLEAQVQAWRNPPEPNQDEPSNRGERQFANQTAQRSQAMPEDLRRELLSNDEQRYYDKNTNRGQLDRAWERYQQEGFDACRDQILQAEHLTTDDIAMANLLMALAFRSGDVNSAMELAHRYNVEGTAQGQALQARQLFSRMTPTGARAWIAGGLETQLSEHMAKHKRQRQKVDETAGQVKEDIQGKQGGDQLARLNAASEFTIDETNNRWGVPINEQQQALIDQYKLNNVRRPGVFYNRATTKQRMLEAILATPNPLELTGNGLNLIQRLEYLKAGEAVVTNADLNYIGYHLAQYASSDADAQAGREGDLHLSRAYEAYGNITPATAREKTRTWRYTSMLLSVPSALRNIIGNAGQVAINTASDSLATELDRLISRATGERTKSHISLAEQAEGWHAYAEETQNTFRDFFTDKAVTHHGEDRFNLNQRGRVFQGQVPETLRLVEGFLMSVGDRNFWKRAYVNSMAEQQRVAKLNGVELDYEEAVQRATHEANFATFSEDNAVRDALGLLKRTPVVGEVLDFVIPFTGVPSNIVRRMWQYSPMGLATSAIRHAYRGLSGQDFNQLDFVNSMARGLTGTALFAIGMALGSLGFIKLGTGEEEDKKVYGVESAQGKQYAPYIQVGEEYISLSAFAPAVSPFIAGAAAYDIFKDDEDSWQALYNAATSMLDQILDASYMSNLKDIFGGYGSVSENIGNVVMSSAISQNIPSVVSQLALALDPYVRDTKDKNSLVQALNAGLVQKIPGLRGTLPEKVDVAGRSVESKEGLRNFFDPLTTTDAIDDPALNELMRLYNATGVSSFFPSDALSGTKNSLTGVDGVVEGKDKEAYKKRYGELWRLGGSTFDKDGNRVTLTGVADLIQTTAYQRMTDEEKAEAISGIVSAAKDGAVYEMGDKLGHSVKEEASSEGYTKQAVRAMPERFAQSESPLIQKLAELYEETGDGAFIPKGISGTFSRKEVKYKLTGEEFDLLWSMYEAELEERLAKIDWAASPEEVAQSVTEAYTNAAKAAKDDYAKDNK